MGVDYIHRIADKNGICHITIKLEYEILSYNIFNYMNNTFFRSELFSSPTETDLDKEQRKLRYSNLNFHSQ